MIGRNTFFVSGKVPQVFSWITVLNRPRDTLFSALQATVQARQPMQLRRSMTIAHRGALAFAAWASTAGKVVAAAPAAAVPMPFNTRRRLTVVDSRLLISFSWVVVLWD
jgi:hypothetical protein